MKKQVKRSKEKQNTKSKPSKKEDEVKDWFLINAKGKVLGRLSTQIAKILMGKDKITFARHIDAGDNVVVINAAKIVATGNKEEDKKYYRYSGYPSGLKETTLAKLREKKPEDIIYRSVSGMLPKNRLGRQLIKKLYVYPKDTHPHEAQKPKELESIDA